MRKVERRMGVSDRVILFFLFLLLLPSIYATSINNVPTREQRDIVVVPGLERSYSLGIAGANVIAANAFVPLELEPYVTLIDPMPGGGPRGVTLQFSFPERIDIPPGIYTVGFNANEVPPPGKQITTSVSIGLAFIVRVYSDDLILDMTRVDITPVPIGTPVNISATIISRTTQEIPMQRLTYYVLAEDGSTLAYGTARHGPLASGESVEVIGTVDTSDLPGGIYRTNVTAEYDGPTTWYDQTILRIGTLTIDVLDDYTKSFTFNETNKFTFGLKSNWNKPLANVQSNVQLLGQSKRSASVRIPPFGESERLEVYFDRTELPPGRHEGVIVVTYQEQSENPSLQALMEEHTFRMPIAVDVVLPPAPVVVETPWKPTFVQVVVGVSSLLLLLNILLIIFLLRRKKKDPPTTTSTPMPAQPVQRPSQPPQQPPQSPR
jgi:hypothetical protein